MTVAEIIKGESKDIEFKEMLPKNSEKYTKTIIAYANTQGGKVIFGVADETREIVGIDEAILFQTMDSIANAVSDSCEPQIVPDIEPYTLDGKTVIVVTVVAEPSRPYYLKSKGKDKGTYIRVGGTTRLASADKIKELEMEGDKISWDELLCVGFDVTEKAIKKLCKDMNVRRREMQEQKGLKEKLPTVTRTNLENWKVLKKSSDGYLASNAFALLTSDYFPFSKTQCAVFKGIDRAVFLDKREYTGPIYEQVDEAINFVLRNIRLGAKIEGLLRKESYELPVAAIREMIVNAHCHRNMRDESCVQVAIYDDRLEVTSPGGLYNGLTFEEALQGHSKLRNRAIANVFSQIGFIESWGTGLQRIQNLAKEYELPDVEFIEMPETFRVNLYRMSSPMEYRQSIGETSVEPRQKSDEGIEKGTESKQGIEKGTESKQGIETRRLMEYIIDNPKSSIKEMAEYMEISVKRIRTILDKMRKDGLITREGAQKNGRWVVR